MKNNNQSGRFNALGSGIGILILRITIGFLMLYLHGIPKLLKYSSLSQNFDDPFGIGSTWSLLLTMFAEILCSILIIFGLLTRWALIPLIITMVVAVFIIHGADDLQTREKAILYLSMFLVLFITGPGKISVDHLMKKRKKKLSSI